MTPFPPFPHLEKIDAFRKLNKDIIPLICEGKEGRERLSAWQNPRFSNAGHWPKGFGIWNKDPKNWLLQPIDPDAKRESNSNPILGELAL